MKFYGFVGTPGYDLILYLGMLLQKAGKSIIILDYSKEKEFAGCMPGVEDTIIHFYGIDMTISMETLWKEKENYDIGLICFSYSHILESYDRIPKQMKEIERFYILSDFHKKHITLAAEILKRETIKCTMILRDVCSPNLDKLYFLHNYAPKEFKPENLYEMIFDELDFEARIRMEYEVIKNLKKLSKGMKSVLFLLTEEMTQLTKKQFKKIWYK